MDADKNKKLFSFADESSKQNNCFSIRSANTGGIGNNIYRKDGKIKNGEWQIEKGSILVNPGESPVFRRDLPVSNQPSFPFARSRATPEFHHL
jgi:hypothetical protein